MKKIIFLGAMHDDPSGKSRLHRAITDLTTKYERAPDFVAVEWAQATHVALVSMRSDLATRLFQKFPEIEKGLLVRFADTLGYEPDLLQEIGPPPKPVWMLNGSQNDVLVAGTYIAERGLRVKITNLEDWLLPRIPNFNRLSAEDLLTAATSVYMEESERLANLTDADNGLLRSIQAGRDSYMFKQMQDSLVDLPNGESIGVIIVGTGHLTNVSGSLFNLCLNNGLTVERLWPHEQ